MEPSWISVRKSQPGSTTVRTFLMLEFMWGDNAAHPFAERFVRANSCTLGATELNF